MRPVCIGGVAELSEAVAGGWGGKQACGGGGGQVAAGQGCDPTGAGGGGIEAPLQTPPLPPHACGSEELPPTRCWG